MCLFTRLQLEVERSLSILVATNSILCSSIFAHSSSPEQSRTPPKHDRQAKQKQDLFAALSLVTHDFLCFLFVLLQLAPAPRNKNKKWLCGWSLKPHEEEENGLIFCFFSRSRAPPPPTRPWQERARSGGGGGCARAGGCASRFL